MRFYTLPADNLLRRPARSLLTAAGIAVALGCFVALLGLSRGIESAFVDLFVGRNSQLVAVRAGTVEIFTATLDESLADGLRRVEGVADAAGELYELVELAGGDNALVTGWPEGSYLWDTVALQSGSAPGPNESRGALLGETVAQALGARVGATVVVGGNEFVVSGIARASGLLSGTLVVVQLRTLQQLLERPGKVTLFDVRLKRPDDAAAVVATKARLASAFPDLRFTLATDLARVSGPLRILRAVVQGTCVVALLMAVVLIANTLLMSVLERRRDVGILSALGWSPARIVTTIVTEGVLLAALGGLIGLVLGMTGLQALARVPQLQGFLDPQVGLRTLLESWVAVLFLGMSGSAYPAWLATRMNVVEALRSR